MNDLQCDCQFCESVGCAYVGWDCEVSEQMADVRGQMKGR